MNRKTQINLWYAMLAVFGILMFQNWWSASRQVEVMPYSRFEELLDKGVEKLGQIAFEQPRRSFLGEGMPDMGSKDYSEETAREIDCALRELTNAARETALAVLRANSDQLEQGAALLLEKETLLTEEIPRP